MTKDEIEKAAREYAFSHVRVGHIQEDLAAAYIAGAEHAQPRWVSVKDPVQGNINSSDASCWTVSDCSPIEEGEK